MSWRIKRSNYPKWIFFLKNNKIFMYLLPPFILQNFERILRADPVIRMCHFQAQNSPFVLEQIFLVQTIIITFIYLFKILTANPVMRMRHFFAQNGTFTPIFFWKIINIIFIWLLAPFIVQHFKKNPSSGSSVMMIRNVWVTGYALTGFFRKPVNEPCSFHSCHACLYMPKIKVRY